MIALLNYRTLLNSGFQIWVVTKYGIWDTGNHLLLLVYSLTNYLLKKGVLLGKIRFRLPEYFILIKMFSRLKQKI